MTSPVGVGSCAFVKFALQPVLRGRLLLFCACVSGSSETMIAALRILAALFLAAISTSALADPARCFAMTAMDNWRSPDGKTIYIRADVNRYFRLELARECSTLKSINPHLVLANRTALDLDVKASESPGGIAEPCFAKTLSELSPAEAAALPKGVKP
jgi:hypothetical protein